MGQTLPAPAQDRWQNIFKTLLNRNKRQAEGGLLTPTEEDKEEFKMNLANWKLDLASGIGNLTCVLSKLGMLDDNLQINMDVYMTQMWEEMDTKGTLAAEDPEWAEEHLERNPFMKVFGRHHVFFQCAKKVEEKGCAAAEMLSWLEAAYGKDHGDMDYSAFKLPKNKYERAALVTLVMYESETPAQQMISEFFYGKSDFF